MVKMSENGDKTTVVEIAMTKANIKTITWLVSIIFTAATGSGWFFGLTKEHSYEPNQSGRPMISRIEQVERSLEETTKDCEDTGLRLSGIEAAQTENRRFMVAIYKQLKLLCEKSGVQVLYDTNDFFGKNKLGGQPQ